ncbi:DUF1778 domain-containing protein [Rhizobium sp. BK060]|uniref:type II toxin-antitoxin system TacA family antitoxin n=1 Tax=Rhizobium sp. BK060 TaxID=2587096 RepID=UPI0017A49575|nr:DUF1778 domain-containing protein [Rhizobium sp. BK060]MBB3396383.1 uncharacterized protein (DUF1778 family) [Rhizobium sp. BK060]
MCFRDDDLAIIDRGASLTGLFRTGFKRRAPVQEAQTAILNEIVIRVSADAFEAFVAAIEAQPVAAPAKVVEPAASSALGTLSLGLVEDRGESLDNQSILVRMMTDIRAWMMFSWISPTRGPFPGGSSRPRRSYPPAAQNHSRCLCRLSK